MANGRSAHLTNPTEPRRYVHARALHVQALIYDAAQYGINIDKDQRGVQMHTFEI